MNTSNNPNFFNKKRTIFLVVFFVIVLVLIGVTISQVLNINFNSLISSINTSLKNNPLFGISLFILLISPLFKVIGMFFIYLYEMKSRKIYVRIVDLFMLVFIYNFIVSITPSSIGGEPWLIYWLRKKNIPLNESSAFVLFSSTVAHAGATLITWPSFIYFLVTISNNINNYQFIIIFTSVGMGMEFIVLCVFLIMAFSTKIQYIISKIFNKCLKFFNFKYKDDEQLKREYDNQKIFRLIMISYYKKVGYFFYIFIISLLSNFILYTIFYFALNLCTDIKFSFIDAFNAVNISVTANNFIPLPGSEGSIQVLLQKILGVSLVNINLSTINESIFVWRFATNYYTLIIGIFFIVYYIYIIVSDRKNQKLNAGVKNNRILIIQNRSHNTIGGIETYNRNLISIFKNYGLDVYELPLINDQNVLSSKFLCPKYDINIINGESKYYEKTKYFEKVDEVNPLLQFIYMKRFINNSLKMVKNHLKTNSYDLIIDSSFFGFNFLFKNPNYVWIQHNSKKSRNGMIYNNFIMNFFGLIATKFLKVRNTFKFAQNVVLFDEMNEKDINYKWKQFYKIPLFYDGEFIDYQNEVSVENKKFIVFMGRLEKDQKRCDLLLKIAPLVNAPIYVYGDGVYKDKLSKCKNIVFKGKFNHNQIKEVFSDKCLTLILSNHEGFPFTAIESLANGTTVLIRDTFPSARYFINQNKNGILINKHWNYKKIAKSINDYLLNTNKSIYFNNCCEFANNNFKREYFETSWINLYNELSKCIDTNELTSTNEQ